MSGDNDRRPPAPPEVGEPLDLDRVKTFPMERRHHKESAARFAGTPADPAAETVAEFLASLPGGGRADALTDLAKVHADKGELPEAEARASEAVELLRQNEGLRMKELPVALKLLGRVRILADRLGRDRDALPLLRGAYG